MSEAGFSADDHRHMARALALAARVDNAADPNPRVGCVLVRDGQRVGEGWHHAAGTPHAEVHALAAAGPRARGATAYVTLEPCSHVGRTPPCANALIGAGVTEVVAAVQDPNPLVAGRGLAALQAAGIAARSGCMRDAARAVNRGFFSRYLHGRPFVQVKLAASLDGATAMADGTSKWITGSSARAQVQQMRAQASAVLTGIGTVLADNPSLNVRLPPEPRWQAPARVVLDSALRTPADARLLRQEGAVHILHSSGDMTRVAELEGAGATLHQLPADDDGGVALEAAMDTLGTLGLNQLMVEAGATLNGALLRAGLIDELVLFMAPLLMGNQTRQLFATPWLQQMDDRRSLTVTDVRHIGADLRITLHP